jgi:hypothetical protein
MLSREVALRWFKRLAAVAAAPKKYEAVLYIDGPLTKWPRSRANYEYEEHQGGLRIPLKAEMPKPDEREVIQRRQFAHLLSAKIWVLARLRGFDTTKIVGEVRPL